MGYSMPYFTIWAAEMLADGRFQTWNLEERGAWLTLIAYNWNDEDLPAAHTDLARLLHVGPGDMARIWSAIGDRFAEVPGKPGRIWSPRLEEERDRAVALSEKRGKAGKKGANARWDKEKKKDGKRMRVLRQPQCDEDGGEKANRCPPTPAPSSTPTPTPTSPPTEDPPFSSQPDDRGVVRLAGDGQGLGYFRNLLAQRLGVGRVTVGKNPADVIRFFQAQLASVGEDELLADCVEAAKRSTSGTPSSLSWFVGWLDRLPVPVPEARQ